MNLNRVVLGITLAAATGLIWGAGSPAYKLLGQQGVSMVTVTFLRCAVGGPVLWLLFRLLAPRHLRAAPRDLLRVLLLSILAPALNYLGFMLSVVYLPVATANVLHYVNPFVIALGSALLLHERPTACDLIGAAVVFAGVTCSVLTPEWRFDAGISIPGLLWGVLAIFGITAQALCGRAGSGGGMSGLGFFCWSHLLGTLWIALYKTFAEGWGDLAALTPAQMGLIAVPLFGGTVLGFSAFYAALQYVPAPTVTLLTSMEVPSAILFTALVLGARPTAPQALGCALILAAVALSSFGARRRGETVSAPPR